jgi:hypothetical protein
LVWLDTCRKTHFHTAKGREKVMRKKNSYTIKIRVTRALFGLLALLVLTAFAGSAQATSLFVDAAAPPNGDGSPARPFLRITDAVERARAIRGGSDAQIDIHVAPGTYVGSYTDTAPAIEPLPIRLDVPRLKLFGNTSMQRDGAGLPTGVIQPGSYTLLLANPPLVAGQALLEVAPTSDGVVLEHVTIAKLSLDTGSGDSGWGLRVVQVQDFTILDNYVTGGMTGQAAIGIQAGRSSGQILGNYVTRGGCGICVVAGNASSPASVVVSGNRSVSNNEGGILLSGSTLIGLPSPGGDGGVLSAVVCGNDLSDNNFQPNSANPNFFSFGLRVFLINNNNDLTSGSVTATICNNRFRNNSAGVVMDAGFVYRSRNSTLDPRLYTGTFDLTFADNDLVGNIRTPALISFTRFTASNTPAQLNPVGTSYKYLERSVYDITYSNGELDGYWFDLPGTDPMDGRELKNVLRINGDEIPNGRYIPYP